MASGTTISLCHRPGDNPSRVLRMALDAVREYATRVALDAAMTRQLTIVAEELMINLLEHGAAADGCARINVTLRLDLADEALVLVLEDNGTPFDPRSVAPVDLPNAERGGGVGLALVKAFARIDDYVTENGRNRLTLQMNSRREGTP